MSDSGVFNRVRAVPLESWVRWLWMGGVLWELVVIGARLEAIRRLEIESASNSGQLAEMKTDLTSIRSSSSQIELEVGELLDMVGSRR